MLRNILMIVLSGILAACTGGVNQRRLNDIADIASDSPTVALRQLDSIKPGSLSAHDRHYRDLLIVKATDKAYMPHLGDSLIMSVVGYAERHSELQWYPEALYYAGRVYSDLGDYPTALEYFHKAIDTMGDNDDNPDLRSRILSQTGRLLDKVGAGREALNAIDKAIAINKTSNDTLNWVYNLQLAGDICLRQDSLEIAESYFTSAQKIGKHLPLSEKAKTKMNLASVKYRLGDVKTALCLIRDAVESVDDVVKPTAIAHAAQIYHAAGIRDSAYMYAQMLISPNIKSVNRHVGYQLLLASDMRRFSSQDSIDSYISAYTVELNKHLRDGNRQLSLTRQASYNYSLHERKSMQAEKSRDNLLLALFATGMILFALLAFVFYLKYRNRNIRFHLRQALDTIDRLSAEINADIAGADNDIYLGKDSSIEDMRTNLQKKLLSLSNSADAKSGNDRPVLDKNIYGLLQDKIKTRQVIADNDLIWDKIEKAILRDSPKFEKRLSLLCVKEIKTDLWHTALLIKLGMSPTEISKLMGRSKSAITMRRITLGELCFDKKFDSSAIDSIIRLL